MDSEHGHLSENKNSNSYQRFVEILQWMGKHPLGFGLGLAGMIQANIAGNLLRISQQKEKLEELISGNKIFSAAISEKGWKGRLKNTQTSLKDFKEAANTHSHESTLPFVLNGEKSFASNGRSADFYLVACKNGTSEYLENQYLLLLIPSSAPNLKIEPFDLESALEATHASIYFENLRISSDQVLPIDYAKHGRYLPNWERFCFHFLFLGLSKRIQKELGIESFADEIGTLEKNLQSRIDKILAGGISTTRIQDSILGRSLLEKILLHLADKRLQYPDIALFEKLLLP
jgi:alkylation response protein AidB-like acyl-CoA dehydrogenase